MPAILVYLCIWALTSYASAAIQSGDSNFIKRRNILFKSRQNTSSHGAGSRRLAGQCSNDFYNKPFFMRFVPETEEIVVMHAVGHFDYYQSPDHLKTGQYKRFGDINEKVLWAGIGGFQFDPKFNEGHRYIYCKYRGNPENTPWPNTKIDASNRDRWVGASDQCPELSYNNEQYCKGGTPNFMCETYERIERIEVDENWNTKSAVTIWKNGCSGEMGHFRQSFDFFHDGTIVFPQGDNSNTGVQYDEGSEENDACFDSSLGYPQGLFRAQRMEFTQGKIITMESSVYRTAQSPVGVNDYTIIGKGVRQPFRTWCSKDELKCCSTDVGDNDGERIFCYNKYEFTNFGWPCVEGWAPDQREDGRMKFLRSKGEDAYDICEPVYAARGYGKPGSTADPNFKEASFSYWEAALNSKGPIDPTHSGCIGDAAAITGIAVLDGNYHNGGIGSEYQGDMLFADYARGCVLRFKGNGNNFDFSQPHIVMDGRNQLGVSDIQVNPVTGHIYIIDHRQYRILRIVSSGPSSTAPPTPPPPFVRPSLPLVDTCQVEDLPVLSWSKTSDGSYWGSLSVNGIEYTNSHGTTSTRAFEGKIPGPIIKMKPGATYHLQIKNNLDQSWPNPDHGKYTFSTPCKTNIHLHGLHISGGRPADAIDVQISPGLSYTYTYQVPEDHSEGLHIYHAHHEGSTSIQAGGGMVGFLVVENNPHLDPTWPEAPDKYIHMQDMSPGSLQNIADGLDENELYRTTANDDHYLLNGCDSSSFELELASGKWYRLRMLHFGRANNVLVSIMPPAGSTSCKLGLLALDGVFVEGPIPRMMSDPMMFFTLASRADVMVMCPEVGTHKLEIREVSSRTLLSSSDVIVSEGGEAEPDLEEKIPIRPFYLQNLLGESDPRHYTISLAHAGEVNGIQFQGFGAPPLTTANINELQEWTISNTGSHPWHMHVNHMQLMEFPKWPNMPADWAKSGDWLDTIGFPGAVTVRFKPERYSGTALMHCHTSEHAEQGMSAILYINGGNGPLDGSQVENWPDALPPSQCGNGELELGETTDSCYPGGTCPLDIGIQAEDVCCLKSCGVCGGADCDTLPGGASGCCKGTIRDDNKPCGEPPCIVESSPNPTPEPTPSGTCPLNIGIQAEDVCCLKSCGVCGGADCDTLPGGASGCCKGTIRDDNKPCGEPPCVV